MTASILLDPTGHPIIGHRGASGSAPENTLPSFDLAAAEGAEAFELDVRLSRDGVPMVFHDPTLDRTTNLSGPIGDRLSEELSQCDAGAQFESADGSRPYQGAGIGVPSLEAVIERFPAIPMLIELKEVAAAEPVRSVVERHRAVDRVVLASFHDRALGPFRAAPWRAGAGRRAITELALRAAIGLRPIDRGFACYAVPDRYKGWLPVPTRRFMAAAAQLGVPVHVWTVDSVAVAEGLWALGGAGVITNFPARMLEARKRHWAV